MKPVSQPAPESVERPKPGAPRNALCGSDVIADAIRDLGNEAEIVSDEEDRHAGSLLLQFQLVDYLGLDRHIECRCRFICD